MKLNLLGAALLFAGVSFGQANIFDRANVTGNIETNLQYLNTDTTINAFAPEQKAVMNTYMLVNYSLGKFSAGARFESYLPSIAGYPAFYDGTGIGYRYAAYNGERLGVQVGNFYEQFGSGLIFRSYEERALGLDNAMDGASIRFNPFKGGQIKGVFGKQRYNFVGGRVIRSEGIVRGLDAELNLNDVIPGFADSKFKVSMGGSLVSKYQAANNDTLIIPKNVASYGGRLSLKYGKFYMNMEYVHKDNDPSAQNGYIYNSGHGALVNMGYSRKGFAVLLSGKSIDNLAFRSDRDVIGNQLFINYLPALSNQHTYNLAGTLYPYASVPNGEVAYQADIIYKIPKKSKLGGKYGTDLHLNVAVALAPMQHKSEVEFDKTRRAYKGNLFDSSDSLYLFDLNFHMSRKFSKKFKASAHYFHFVYNNKVNEVTKDAKGYIHSNIFVIDMQYKLAKKHAIRMELQGLFTNNVFKKVNESTATSSGYEWVREDKGDWATILLEYTISPNWFFAFMDQWNYGNPNKDARVHYMLGSFGYSFKSTRFMLSYGKQREGIFCIGGVCRPVPATNGLTFTFTSSF